MSTLFKTGATCNTQANSHGRNFETILFIKLSLVATASAAADAASARGNYAREENVFFLRGADRVAISAHSVIGQRSALPRFNILATRYRKKSAHKCAADEQFCFHVISSKVFR